MKYTCKACGATVERDVAGKPPYPCYCGQKEWEMRSPNSRPQSSPNKRAHQSVRLKP